MDPKPPPPPPPHQSSAAYTSFPILAISILGILTTAIFLLSYYIFVIKCCLNWRRPDLLLLFRRSRRFQPARHITPPVAAAATANPPPGPCGLDISTINSIPTFRFSKPTTTTSVECAVCLSDFRDQELLRLLPNCAHAFHIDCIDTWLQFNPNCPLCRAEIRPVPFNQFGLAPLPAEPHSSSSSSSSVVIDIRENDTVEQQRTTTPKAVAVAVAATKTRRFWQMASMGDECIDIGKKDERFVVQPIRRSFSMDSSNDRQLYVSVQEILRQNPRLFREVRNGEGSSNGGGGSGNGRIRRSFFSFGRSSRSAAAVLPAQNELS